MTLYPRLVVALISLLVVTTGQAECNRNFTLAYDTDYVPYQYADTVGRPAGLDSHAGAGAGHGDHAFSLRIERPLLGDVFARLEEAKVVVESRDGGLRHVGAPIPLQETLE